MLFERRQMTDQKTSPQFYNENNLFMRRLLRPDSFYKTMMGFAASTVKLQGFVNDEPARKELLSSHKYVAGILESLPPGDPAFEYMYNEVVAIRKLLLYSHLCDTATPKKQLCCLFQGVHNQTTLKELEEICSVYGLKYKLYFPYAAVGSRPNGIVIDLRETDFDDPQFLEAMETIFAIKKPLHGGYIVGVEYAECFF